MGSSTLQQEESLSNKKKAKADTCNQQLEMLKTEMKDLTQRKQLLVDAWKKLDN